LGYCFCFVLYLSTIRCRIKIETAVKTARQTHQTNRATCSVSGQKHTIDASCTHAR